jgi:acyl carrier protein
MRQAIRAFIVTELLSGTDVTDDQELLVSGLVDSLGVMRLVAFIDKDLGIRVPHADIKLRNFATIDAITGYLEVKQAS